LFIGAAFMLYKGITQFNESQNNLESLKVNLEGHYNAKVFPSQENVKIEIENAKQADEWFGKLESILAEGNVSSTERSPSHFITAGNKVRRSLEKKARKSGTSLPDSDTRFAFGFERYTGSDGALPKSADVPRLIEQLVIINRISNILFNNGIKELSAVKRDVFESTGDASVDIVKKPTRSHTRNTRGRTARVAPTANADLSQVGIIGDEDLFAKMHFVFEFRAKEKALLDILNAFSTSKMFIVVTSVTISKGTPELVPAVVDPDAAEADDLGFSRSKAKKEEPVAAPKLGPNYPVCGIKMEIPMDIHLELDVYKFKEADCDSGN